MEWVGKIAVHAETGQVWQVFEREFRISFMNSSLAQYAERLGAWLRFRPQFLHFLSEKLKETPSFSLFENPEIYLPIQQALTEIDPEAIRQEENYWPRCCEPDIV